jgi:TolB-like protein/predicted Zn-dependent protease
MTVAKLTLFGSFTLRLADGDAVDLPGQKDRALLAILALSGGAPLPRDKLAGLLWGDRGEAQARDSLKHALNKLRQSLAAVAPVALETDRQMVRFDGGGVECDVARFEALLRQGAPADLEQASLLYAGDLLDGINVRDSAFEDWLLAERRRLRRLCEEALGKLLAPGLPAAMRERAAQKLLTLDPLREAAERTLMQVLAERGEVPQAIQRYEDLRQRLQDELGVKPEAETVALHEAIRQGRVARAAPVQAEAPALPAKPSIAILAFENLSGDPAQDYFADGMVEEIITALSRMRWLFVIARNSSFIYRGRAMDVKQIGRELGVRYVLEGSVRKGGSQLRISGKLIDCATSAHLWADRFDGGLEDVFDLQDRVATSVVGAIAPKLEQAEIERAKRKPTESLDAYDHYLRGVACVHQWTKAASDEALRHFHRAIDLDPGYASAYGMAARCYSARKVSGWVDDLDREVAESARLARHVMKHGKDDPVALYTAGMALAYVVGDLEDGGAMIEQALALDPNAAWGWLFAGWTKVWLGEPEAALERIARAMRLSPQDPQFFNMRTASAWAHLLAGRHDEALSWAQSALREQPDYINALYVLAAGGALAGRIEEARAAVAQLQRFDPDPHVAHLQRRYPFRRDTDRAHVAEGLRLAGLPD